MLCHVEAIHQILFGHVVGFVSQSALPQKHQDFKWVSASYVGSIGGSNTAILRRCWHHFGINFGHLGAHDDAMWAQMGIQLPASPKTIPNYTSKTLPPWPSRRNKINSKNHTKNKISSKMLIPMGGKPKRNQKSSKNTSPKS